jgi:pimeloyl-ACP methyl ester carboxylesterase
MTTKSVQLAQGWMHYMEGGEGENLLFLHGVIATSEAYIPLLELLSRTYHVVAPIHPGHGKTFAIPHGWKLEDYVLCYQDFFADIEFVPDILIGHSFGGMLALVLASRGIGRLVVAMDAPGLTFHFDTMRYMDVLAQEGRDVLKKRSDLRALAQTSRAAGTIIETIVRHPQDISLFVSAGPRYTIAPQVKKITIPTYLLWGENDEIVPVETGRRLEKLIPGARLQVFPGIGHNYSVTDPEFTYKQLSSILLSHDKT